MSSIDVVVPCYRYGKYLRACVESILAQAEVDVRVLILDDESPDETPLVGARLAAEDARVTYWRNPANLGHIDTYNRGLEWAQAPYLLLLSADDFLLPGALGPIARLMDIDDALTLCFGNAVVLGADGRQRETTVNIDCNGSDHRVLSGFEFMDLSIAAGASNIVPTPTAVVRTSLIKKYGGYRKDLPHSADMELWLRLAAHGSVGFIKKPLAVYRRHADNMSLGYTSDHCLSDLQQRGAACDEFLRACRDVVPGIEKIHRRLLRSLALETLGHASSAFNSNQPEQSKRLRELAIGMHPKVRLSNAWMALKFKNLIGFKLSSSLLPIVTRWRLGVARVLGSANPDSPPSAL